MSARRRRHHAVLCVVAIGLSSALAACGNSGPTVSGHATTSTTLAPTTTASSTTTTSTTAPSPAAGVVVPDVIGLKIAPAKAALHAVGLVTVPFNVACNKGTVASQSVVASLSSAGKPPDVQVGATPLAAGTTVPRGTRVGITWSGCYGNGSTVPAVVGLTFGTAKRALAAAGLTWACYSSGGTTTTTTTSTSTSAPTSSTTTTRPPRIVLSQNPGAGTVVRPGTAVALTMHTCPQ
jgi:beta-lactam-binding protein with PASTA domain